VLWWIPPQATQRAPDWKLFERGNNPGMTQDFGSHESQTGSPHGVSKPGSLSMQKFIQYIRKLLGLKPREHGATMVEYGLMVALIAVVCLLAVTALGGSVKGVFEQIGVAI